MKRFHLLGLGALIALLALALAAANASAATRLVAPGGSDATGCLAEPCATIQHAVDVASAGDVVEVAAGTYAEALTVAKRVTLRGAQAGVRRFGREVPPAQESLISAPGQTVTVNADSVVIEGFAFENSTIGGAAIVVNAITNLRVAGNLRDGGDGALVSAANATSMVIRDNRVVHTMAPAIFLGGNTEATLIEGNELADGTSTGIELNGANGLNVEAAIVGNRLSRLARGIWIQPGSTGSGVAVRENVLAGLSIVGLRDQGSGSVDARRNWWGCNGGPNAAGCSTLEATGTPPDSSDWLTLALSAEPASAVAGEPVALRADLLGSATGSRAAAFPDGTAIGFGTSLGQLSGVGTTVAGRASATLVAPRAGVAAVTASLDSQLVQLPVTVVAPPDNGGGGNNGGNGGGNGHSGNGHSGGHAGGGAGGAGGGNSSPAPAPPRTITLLLLHGEAEVAAGRAKVIASCAAAVGQRCAGELRLGNAGQTARASFDLGAGRRTAIAVRVPEAALERLGRRPQAVVTAHTRQDAGAAVVSQRRLRLVPAGPG